MILRILMFMTLILSVPGPSAAQLCGDADGNGVVSVTDGVLVLRSAAGLPDQCPAVHCDVNGDGQISVTDGVAVLRAAAELPAVHHCVSDIDITTLLQSVGTTGGDQGLLEIGVAPLPNNGSLAVSITDGTPIDAQGNGPDSGDITGADFSASTSAASPATQGTQRIQDVPALASLPPRELIVAALAEDGGFAHGFFTLPIPAGSSLLDVRSTFTTVNVIPRLRFAVRAGDAVGPYELSSVVLDVTSTAPVDGILLRLSYPAGKGFFVRREQGDGSASCGLGMFRSDHHDRIVARDDHAGTLTVLVADAVELPPHVRVHCLFHELPMQTLRRDDIAAAVQEVVVGNAAGDPTAVNVSASVN